MKYEMLDEIFLYWIKTVNRDMLQYSWVIELGSSGKSKLIEINWFYLLDLSLVPNASHCLFPWSIHKARGQNYNCVSEHLQENDQKDK